MRYVFGFLCVCALAGHLPLSATAQDGEEDTSPEPSLEESAPSSEPAPEQPALQLRLDDAGVGVAPGYPPRFDELELRLKRARIGLLSTAGVSLAGMGLVIAGARVSNTQPSSDDKPANALKFSGVALLVAGIAGMVVSGIALKTRRRQLDRYEPAPEYTLEETERRVRRARLGLGFSVVATTVVGPLLIIVGFAASFYEEPGSPSGLAPAAFATGFILTLGGIVGMGVSGSKLRRRKRDRDRLKEQLYGRPRRVQWDLTQSRLVF
jgi:cytochrome c biogenesis protein CcdA